MKYLVIVVAMLLSVSSAEARKRQIVQQAPASFFELDPSILGHAQAGGPTGNFHPRSRAKRAVDVQIVAHPAGCPRRAFCGCGASVRLFGRPIRELFLARNWYKFPAASPAPGMVAVRRNHVYVIEAVLDNGLVTAYDANSGRRQTRIHTRSLAGFSVRNPQGGVKFASMQGDSPW